MGVIGPVMTLPQVYAVWVLKQAEGVSVLTWASYVGTNLFWIAYGLVHREKPIILTYCLWIIMNGSVALGAIVYG